MPKGKMLAKMENLFSQKTRQKVLKVAKGQAKVKEMNLMTKVNW